MPVPGKGRATLNRVFICTLAAMVAVACLVFAAGAAADGITNSGDDLRTGWYPDEGAITPQLVSGNTFGELWSAPVNGQVYAQPLLSPTGTSASPTGMLVVATETDNVYGLDPVNGAQQWTTNLGRPFNPADISCPDIQPSIGTTSTPVIDTSTKTVYLTHKAYAPDNSVHWYMDALNIATGAEQPGWPVESTTGGAADNAPVTFFPRTQQQRPGLLLMNGVVYAAFGVALRYTAVARVGVRRLHNHPRDHGEVGRRGRHERRRHLAVGRRAHLRRVGSDPSRHRQRRLAHLACAGQLRAWPLR